MQDEENPIVEDPKPLKAAAPVRRSSPRGRVVQWIANAIASGELQPGDVVPTVDELAQSLGVARNTAAAGVLEAERRRIVERRTPGARKRYVPVSAADAPLAASTVCVLGELGRFADGLGAPRWSDAYITQALLPLISQAGRHVTILNNDILGESDVDALFRAPPAGMAVTSSVLSRPLAMRALQRCREAGVPAVVYGNAPQLRFFDRVYTDHRAGARMLTEWLIGRGRRRIVPLFPFPPTTYYWSSERVEGYAGAMRATGLEPLPSAVLFDTALDETTDGGRRFRLFRALAVAKLVELRRDGGVDALLCVNDEWTQPVLAAIRDLGLEPNRDILVAGYDNITRAGQFAGLEKVRPAVTIDKHNEKTAADLAALLLARMAGDLPPEPQARTHDQELVVVES